MAKLTTGERKSLPKKTFAVKKMKNTGKPGFPMPDDSHARAAERLAPRSYNAGNISKSTEEKIVSKARSKLKGKK